MEMMKFVWSLCALFLLTLFGSQQLHAQRPDGTRPAIGIMSGTVIDALDESPIEFATVTLYSKRDSSIVTGSVTDKKGKFYITEIPLGAYEVKITFIGYELKNIGPLRLNPKESTTADLGTIR